MTRLMECVPLAEGVEVQYVGVYVLKWRREWGSPTHGFREIEVPDAAATLDLKTACESLENDDGAIPAPIWDAIQGALRELKGEE